MQHADGGSPAGGDWDAIVVGLGGIGSGAAYWLSRRLGDRVLGLEQFELGHVNGASQDHSRIIRLSYHRPEYVRLARRAYATWAEVEAESRRPDRDADRRARRRARATPRSRSRDYVDSDDGRGGPVRAARRPRDHASLAAVAARRRAPRPVPGGRRDGRPEPRPTPPTSGWPGPTGRRSSTGRPVDGAARRRRRRHRGDDRRRARSTGPARVVLAADAWTNELLASFERRLPLTIIQEQVTYYACRTPADFAPDRFPVWIWMDEPSLLRLPDLRRARPEGGPGRRRREDTTPATRTFERRPRGASRRRRPIPAAPSARRVRSRPLHQDLPLHADPGPRLRPRPPARGAGRPRRPRRRPRLQVRVAVRPDPGRARRSTVRRRRRARSRGFRIDRPILLLDDPPTSFMV